MNFNPGSQKPQKFALWLVPSGDVWPREVQTSSFMTLESDANFEEKLTCGLKNKMRNLANFHQITWTSQNWDPDGTSKIENVWA